MSQLARLFRPKHIAVFGGGWSLNVIQQLQKIGFAGDIWPVHPTKSEVGGLPAFKDVASLPEAPDASFIGVNRNITPQILGDLSQRGAGGAVCFASGFAETSSDDHIVADAGHTSGVDLQNEALIKAGDMPFLGPNCYGFVNYLENVALWPDEHGGISRTSGVAIITQSSNMAITLSMARRSLPLGFLGTAGNQAQIDMCDMADALLDDARITALGLHIEGIADRHKLQALATKARAKNIPIIALKVGKSQAAQEATMSHTASMAGSDESASALLRRLGIARLDSLGGFVEALKLAHHCGVLPSYEIASLSCSGGEASLVADAAHDTKLTFPPLQERQIGQLSDALGPLVHLSNPLDYQTYIWGDDKAMTATFSAMLDGPQALSLLVLDPPRIDRCDDAPWQPARDCLIEAVKQTGAKAVMISTLSETLTERFCAPAIEAGITPLLGLEDGLAAIAALAEIGACWQKQEALPLWPINKVAGTPVMVTEDDAKKILSDFEIDVPKNIFIKSADEAAEAVMQARLSYPLVIKGMGFAHKTESGAVALNIQNEAELHETLMAMNAPDGFLIEEMISQGIIELLIGIINDPAHGPYLTIGEGGIYTELLQDNISISLPARNEDILAHLRQLRCWPKITGYRGQAGCDVDALLSLIQKLSSLYEQSGGTITEIEMNPVIGTSTRFVAVDALMVKLES